MMMMIIYHQSVREVVQNLKVKIPLLSMQLFQLLDLGFSFDYIIIIEAIDDISSHFLW